MWQITITSTQCEVNRFSGNTAFEQHCNVLKRKGGDRARIPSCEPFQYAFNVLLCSVHIRLSRLSLIMWMEIKRCHASTFTDPDSCPNYQVMTWRNLSEWVNMHASSPVSVQPSALSRTNRWIACRIPRPKVVGEFCTYSDQHAFTNPEIDSFGISSQQSLVTSYNKVSFPATSIVNQHH